MRAQLQLLLELLQVRCQDAPDAIDEEVAVGGITGGAGGAEANLFNAF